MLSSLCVDSVFPWAWIFLIAALIVAAVCSAAAARDESGSESHGHADSEPAFQLVVTSPDKGYTGEQVLANAPDILSLEVAHPGLQRLLFR